eukprot:scaffold158927_cov45-Prasinocladus_malaysianus.AAC.1
MTLGFVVQVRKCSRRLIFLDILEDAARPGAPCLELVVKYPILEVRRVLQAIRTEKKCKI